MHSIQSVGASGGERADRGRPAKSREIERREAAEADGGAGGGRYGDGDVASAGASTRAKKRAATGIMHDKNKIK